MITTSLGPIYLWYGYRFIGWAENPNQMALSTVAMPFLGSYLLVRASGWRRVAYGVAIACNVAVGLATVSDGLRVALLATVGLLGVIAWGQPMRRGHHSLLPYVAYVIVPVLAVVGAVGLGSELLAEFEEISTGVYDEGGQGDARITAWLNGLRAIAESPLVGWGPGSFSGLRGPFHGFEAHNWLIDWGMSTGILGVALHVALLIWATWRALRTRALSLVGIVLALVVFSLFAYTLRQPIYWFLLVLVLVLTEHPMRAPQHGRLVSPGAADPVRAAVARPGVASPRQWPPAAAGRPPAR